MSFFYNQLPVEISDDFINEFGEKAVHVNEVNKRVYKSENPNVYLASFTKFIGKHKSNPVIKQWLLDGFHAFLSVHVECFSNWQQVPVHFIGSIAYYFSDELIEACEERGIRVGNMIKKPIDGLTKYHLDYLLK